MDEELGTNVSASKVGIAIVILMAASAGSPIASADNVLNVCDASFTESELVDFVEGVLNGDTDLPFDIIVVTEDGSGDSRLSSSLQILSCTYDQYWDLFPEVARDAYGGQSNEAYSTLAALEDPNYASDVASGDYIPVFNVDPSETVELQDICIEDCVEEENEEVPALGLSSSWTGPRLDGASEFVLTVVFPERTNSQHPRNGCNPKDTQKAVDEMEAEFGRSFKVVCYDTLNPTIWWSPSSSTDVDGALFTSCRNYFDNKFSAERDEPHELVLCVVRQGIPNGNAQLGGWYSIVAETSINPYPDHPNVPLIVHELGHNFGADHHPDDGWKKYACAVWHRHWWGYHIHTHFSVMNYCYMAVSYKEVDYGEGEVVVYNYMRFDSGSYNLIDSNMG